MNEQELNKELFSSHSIGDSVDIDFKNSKYIKGCKVAAVKFTDYGKVLYDIAVPFAYDYTTVLQNLDSILIVENID